MRLLHTTTLEFAEFFKPPTYGILSHRWGDVEVSYDDMLNHKKLKGEGYRKVIDCCALAKSRGLDYVWIDTCCIDKRSSAELSEAINSMWKWYTHAKECYAYLVDVDSMTTPVGRPFESPPYKSSAWFNRGWTLQELLAPRVVIFYDVFWRRIGEKLDDSILSEITRITPIPRDCLISHFSLNNACVAKKFSWAATRRTTRPEDTAYCLLGLVGINMPLLYGEGPKAFLRLQQEIIRQTNDESVFAWRDPYAADDYTCGLLASEVAAFAFSGDVRTADLVQRDPYTVTNQGLDLHAKASQVPDGSVVIMPLNSITRPTYQCAIALTRVRNRYSRIATAGLGQHLKTVYPSQCEPSDADTSQRFIVRLQRWDTEYEPANVVLNAKIQRFFMKRIERTKRYKEMKAAQDAALDLL
ncbi:hypothetical protein LTR95_007362 [Oleoguttula sp. CCFEE 5521]